FCCHLPPFPTRRSSDLDLDTLAAGNALLSLAGHRRHAAWEAAASMPDTGLLAAAPIAETNTPVLAEPTEAQTLIADYRSLRLTLDRKSTRLNSSHVKIS